MSLTVQINQYELVTEGVHAAILADVVDLGIVESTFQGVKSKKDKGMFVFFVEEADKEGNQKRIFQRFTKSLNAKATLRKLLAKMKVTIEPGKPFDLETLVGRQFQLNIIHADGEGSNAGKKFANIDTIMPPQMGQSVSAPDSFQRAKDRATE